MQLSHFVVYLSRNHKLTLRESVRLAVRILRNKGLLKEYYQDTIPIAPPLIDPYRQGLSTMHYREDDDWPYVDDPQWYEHIAGKADGELPGGLPQHTEDNEEDRAHTVAANKDRVKEPQEEVSDIMGMAPGNEEMLKQAGKNTEKRRELWAQGKFPMKKKFEQKQHNYINKDKVKMSNGKKKLTKEQLMRRIVEHEFTKALFEEFKGRLLNEKAPKGKYPATGTPYTKIAKGVAKSDSGANPYSVAWSMKNKASSKRESKKPSYDEFKESVENYFKDMGFGKVGKQEGVDVWRKKSPKRPKLEDVSCDFVDKKAREAEKKNKG